MAILIMMLGFVREWQLFAAVFGVESLAFSFMLPSGMKVFANAVDGHQHRTGIISAFSTATELTTLVLAVLIPYLYSVDPRLAWTAIGCLCGVAAIPFANRVFAPLGLDVDPR
jgi:hypothetical protein